MVRFAIASHNFSFNSLDIENHFSALFDFEFLLGDLVFCAINFGNECGEVFCVIEARNYLIRFKTKWHVNYVICLGIIELLR